LASLSSRILFVIGFSGWVQRNVLTSQLGLPIDRAPLAGAKSRRSRRTVSFDLLACRRKGAGVRRNILRRKID
jgi:hypothetical protein